MGPKKKPPNNGFYYFMLEIQKEEQSHGNRCDLNRASNLANPLWQGMDAESRKPYNDLAKKIKFEHKGAIERKFTSLGVPFSQIDAEEREKQEFINIMNATIQSTVHNLNEKELIKKYFFVCHVNFFFWDEKSNHYYPAEFAMAVFNLEEGIIDTCHFFVQPGKLPLGFKYQAADWSARTHRIPLEEQPPGETESDYFSMYQKVQQFINKHTPTGPVPPIYTMFDSINSNYSHSAVRTAFDSMCDAANVDISMFRVYNVSILFYELRNKCNPEMPVPSMAIMRNEIEKDVFSYAKDMGCTYHEVEDLSLHCSLSMVRRWIFTICDHCCKYVNVKLSLGCHIPMGSNMHWMDNFTENIDEKRSHKEKDELSLKALTIVDHGVSKDKRHEEKRRQDVLSKEHQTTRLPKTSYSSKIGASFNQGVKVVSGPSSSSRQDYSDEDSEWSVVGRKGKPGDSLGNFGRGRGILNYTDQKDMLPMCGRGRQAARN